MAAMTADQAVREVQQIAGWRSDRATEILLMLQYAQSEREKPSASFPWFLRRTNASAITTVNGTPNYNLPSDFIAESEEVEGNLFLLTAGNYKSRTIFLRKQSFEHLQIHYYGEWPYVYANPPGAITDQSATIAPGVPIDYCLRDTDILLGPVPDAAYTLAWRYWAADTPPTLGQTNLWLTNAPWVLIGDAAMKLCADIGYAEGAQTATGILQRALDNLFRATINRQEQGRRRRMGSML